MEYHDIKIHNTTQSVWNVINNTLIENPNQQLMLSFIGPVNMAVTIRDILDTLLTNKERSMLFVEQILIPLNIITYKTLYSYCLHSDNIHIHITDFEIKPIIKPFHQMYQYSIELLLNIDLIKVFNISIQETENEIS